MMRIILVTRNKGRIYFNLIIIYWYSWYHFQLIRRDFDSGKFTKKDVIKIADRIKNELNSRYRS